MWTEFATPEEVDPQLTDPAEALVSWDLRRFSRGQLLKDRWNWPASKPAFRELNPTLFEILCPWRT